MLYDAKIYAAQSTTDANNYEKGFKGEKSPEFPHVFDTMPDADRYTVIKAIPAGNTYSLMMAKACMDGEQLGLKNETDFIAISLSSTDYVGHQFGPNSMEIEDTYLRLDQDIADLLKYMDAKYGKDGYLLFLTADHGGAHNAVYLQDKDVPAGVLYVNTISDLNSYLKTQFGKDSLVLSLDNYQVSLNNQLIEGNKYDREKIRQSVMQWFDKKPEVAYVIDMEDMNKTPLPEPLKSMAINGYNRKRSGDIQIILNAGWYDNQGKQTGTTHGTWNPYDSHIPLLWYGWRIPKGASNSPVNMTDITATLAALLHVQAPNGCIGKPIPELVR